MRPPDNVIDVKCFAPQAAQLAQLAQIDFSNTHRAGSTESTTLSPQQIRERRGAIVRDLTTYYVQQNWAPNNLESYLRHAFMNSCDSRALQILEESINLAKDNLMPMRATLFCFATLKKKQEISDLLRPGHIFLCAKTFKKLSMLNPAPERKAFDKLLDQVAVLILKGTDNLKIDVYLKLHLAEAQVFPLDSRVDFDLFGDIEVGFTHIQNSEIDDKQWQALSELLDHYIERKASAHNLVKLFLSTRLKDEEIAAQDPIALIERNQAVLAIKEQAGSALGTKMAEILEHLALQKASTVLQIAVGNLGRLLTSHSPLSAIERIKVLCGHLVKVNPNPQLLTNFSQAINDELIPNFSEGILYLERIASRAALSNIFRIRQAKIPGQFSEDGLAAGIENSGNTPEGHNAAILYELTEGALGTLGTLIKRFNVSAAMVRRMLPSPAPIFSDYVEPPEELDSETGLLERTTSERINITESDILLILNADRPSPQPKPKIEKQNILESNLSQIQHLVLNEYERLEDKVRGFGALKFACQRTATRAPAELARFGNDVGKVSYINARDFARFPGKGFVIENLRLEDIFVADQSNPDNMFHQYLAAWPSLAAEFPLLPKTKIILFRGQIVFACMDPRMTTLRYADGAKMPVSIVFFNEHFKNPLSLEAALLPTEPLLDKIGPSMLGFDDFTGFDPSKPDINDVFSSPQALLSDPAFSGRVIPLGDPARLRIGLPELYTPFDVPNLSYLPAWKHYEAEVNKYNEASVEWSKAGHFFHISPAGHKDYETLQMRRRNLDRLKSELEQNEINRVQDLHKQVTRAEKQSYAGWMILRRYLNLFDLFSIGWSYWQKGYTVGEIVTRNSIEDGDLFFGNTDTKTALELKLSEGNDDNSVYWNSNAARMLVLAFEHHAERRLGKTDKTHFPVLVVTDTLRYGTISNESITLDTFDMKVRIGTQEIQLSQNNMSSDDEMFWHTIFLPCVRDESGKMRSMRFYQRESINFNY
jgi:hypothetical protein